MKVVKIIGTLDFGGIEKIFEITALYYKGDKKDIVFLSLGKGGRTEEAIRELGYKVIAWNANTKIPNLRLIGRLVTFLKQERPDVVHASGAEAVFHGVLAARLAGVKVRVGEEIGKPNHSPMAIRIFRMVYKQATGVSICSQMIKEYMEDIGEVSPGKAQVIYNPVDILKFNPEIGKRDKDTFVVVSVCRLDPIKNLGLLIRGIASVRNLVPGRKIALWLVGEGPSRLELEALVSTLGLNDIVTFWGFQPQPLSFLQQASLFVLPSFSEGFPIAAGEAMLTELPAVVTKIGGGPEMIQHGQNGWLLDPNDQEDFNRLLASILGLSQVDSQRIGKQGRETAVDMFSPDHYLKNVWDLYRRPALDSSNVYGKNQSTALS